MAGCSRISDLSHAFPGIQKPPPRRHAGFEQLAQEAARSDKRGLTQHFPLNDGTPGSKTDYKRKRPGDANLRDLQRNNSSNNGVERFKRPSLAKSAAVSQNDQGFRSAPHPPQSEKDEETASRRQYVRELIADPELPRKRARIDNTSAAPSTLTPSFKLRRSSNTTSPASDGHALFTDSNADKGSRRTSSTLREDDSPTPNPRPPTHRRPTASHPTISSGGGGLHSFALDGRAGLAQPSTAKLFPKSSATNERKKGVSNRIGKEPVNANGSRFTSSSSTQFPTLPHQLRNPPPDVESLNKVLQQVPGILTDLNNKQSELIRSLATRVNDQEGRIAYLEHENRESGVQSQAAIRVLEEQMQARFLKLEKRLMDMERENVILKARNDRSNDQVNDGREVVDLTDDDIPAQTQAPEPARTPQQTLTPESAHTNGAHEHELKNDEEEANAVQFGDVVNLEDGEPTTPPFEELFGTDDAKKQLWTTKDGLPRPGAANGEDMALFDELFGPDGLNVDTTGAFNGSTFS